MKDIDIAKLKFEKVGSFSEGLAPVCKKGKWGFVDKEGKLIIKANYEKVRPFHYGFAAVKQGELWGYINKKGKWEKVPQYIEATDFINHSDDPDMTLDGDVWAEVAYEESIEARHRLTFHYKPNGDGYIVDESETYKPQRTGYNPFEMEGMRTIPDPDRYNHYDNDEI
ncbi:MAG: WG repeat-containing protein [Bacteroidales bacterium]|nr:WG repeat-containing protein [Bacteroidales bacterium]